MDDNRRGSSALRLRPLAIEDESQARRAHEELSAEGFGFLLKLQPDDSWSSYLERLECYRQGLDLAEGMVPATFLVADVDGQLVGRVSIRHTLNAHLAEEGGHIGYSVRPAHRRRGYATEMLRQGLVVARAVGVGRVLVTCDDDNLGSATIIENCGGVLSDVVPGRDGAAPKRRYWIDVGPG